MTVARPPDKQADKLAIRPSSQRHVYGPRSLAALVPLVARPAYRRRSPAASHLMADWEAVVGPQIASVSAPRRLFAGTLSIAAAGPTAMELQHVSSRLIERINAHLGQVAVTRLRFVQDFATPRAAATAALPPRAVEQAEQAVSHLPESPLRDALQRLGATVLAARP